MAYNNLSEAERLEYGLNMAKKIDRPQDSDLRILICTATYFVLDGVTMTIRRLESHLRSRGAQVKILSTVPDTMTAEEIKDIIVVPGIKIPFQQAGDYSFGVGLDADTIREIEEYAPNVVHFTVPDFVGLDGIRWCQRNHVAYIGTWHSNYADYLKYYMLEWTLAPGLNMYLRGFFEQIPVIYVPTPYILKKMKEDWGYGRCNTLEEWGRGVDMNLFNANRRSQQFRASKGISEDDIVVLWISRLVPEKRPDIWFYVVQRLQEEGLPVKGVVVGNGTFEKTLAKLSNVTICGWLSGQHLAEAYASSDILLFPSDVETFGNVTLEALSSGCPCVVEKKCGEHLIDNGVTGFTCPAGDAEAFYQATRKLVLDQQLRKQMSKAAVEKAWKFERSVILQQMAENYKDAIVRHQDPGYLRKHMTSPQGAGRSFLAVFCCNFYFVKILAEPFLQSARRMQDIAEHGQECVDCVNSRSRLGLEAIRSSMSLSTLNIGSASRDEETGSALRLGSMDEDSKESKVKRNSLLAGMTQFWASNNHLFWQGIDLCGKVFGVLVVLGLILLVYFSFTIV